MVSGAGAGGRARGEGAEGKGRARGHTTVHTSEDNSVESVLSLQLYVDSRG